MRSSISAEDDIWNMLPNHYPTRDDRDALVARALADPKCQRRVEVWDFFFPLDRKSLLTPLEAEKAARMASLSLLGAELKQDESRIAQQIEQLRTQALHAKSAWEKWSGDLYANLKKRIDSSVALLRRTGIGLLAVCGLTFLAFLANENSGCLAFFALVFAVVGGLLISKANAKRASLTSEVKGNQEREEKNLKNHLSRLEQEEANLASSLEMKKSKAAAQRAALLEEIRNLDARLRLRTGQIPEVPPLEKVHGWFTEELEEVKEELLRDSGQDGRLVRARSAPSIFCIRGPAELQNSSQIDNLYLTKDNLRKHLTARHAGKIPDGSVVDLYGVWIIEFLFLGKLELTSARVFYDFITKRKAVQYRVHPYNAVALVENGSHFREIRIFRNGVLREETIDNVPSISFALENGQKIEISFPNPSFIREAFPDVDPDKRFYDPWREAKEAIAILRENVYQARTQSGTGNGASTGPIGAGLDAL